jgi:hypothetical protein
VPQWSSIGGAGPTAGAGVTRPELPEPPPPVDSAQPSSVPGVAWADVSNANDASDDAPVARSYSWLHMIVLLLVALVLGALIFMLVNQATGTTGTTGAGAPGLSWPSPTAGSARPSAAVIAGVVPRTT